MILRKQCQNRVLGTKSLKYGEKNKKKQRNWHKAGEIMAGNMCNSRNFTHAGEDFPRHHSLNYGQRVSKVTVVIQVTNNP